MKIQPLWKLKKAVKKKLAYKPKYTLSGGKNKPYFTNINVKNFEKESGDSVCCSPHALTQPSLGFAPANANGKEPCNKGGTRTKGARPAGKYDQHYSLRKSTWLSKWRVGIWGLRQARTSNKAMEVTCDSNFSCGKEAKVSSWNWQLCMALAVQRIKQYKIVSNRSQTWRRMRIIWRTTDFD